MLNVKPFKKPGLIYLLQPFRWYKKR